MAAPMVKCRLGTFLAFSRHLLGKVQVVPGFRTNNLTARCISSRQPKSDDVPRGSNTSTMVFVGLTAGLLGAGIATYYSHNETEQLKATVDDMRHSLSQITRAWNESVTSGANEKGDTVTGTTVETLPVLKSENANEKTDEGGNMNFIADVVTKAAPSVVCIEIQGRHPYTGQMMSVSNGSGFIVREDGLILTNAHVVANKQNVLVKLHDGRSHTGVVQAVDPISDLATLKINATNLPAMKLADSSKVQPGEWVVAMGSPFKLSNTVTAGIVSAVERGGKELGLHNMDMGYIQTDAVINFGNSGGPLVNLKGEAVGISTMKVTTGISFAIPSDFATQFLSKAGDIEKRSQSKGWFGTSTKSKRRYIGVTMLTLTPNIINELRSRQGSFPEVTKGVLVHKVVVGSPAYDGGIRPADIILKINGNDVTSSTDVFKAVESKDELKMTVRRGENTVELKILPEEVQ